jgi:hypothetical protein
MKIKHIFIFPAIAGVMQLYAQQNPTANNPLLPLFNGTNSGEFWSRAGNTLNNGTNNILGTKWNSGIFVQTNSGNRMHITHKAAAAPLQPYATSLVNPLPGTRLTRIGISRDGNNPILNPLSLMHVGYDSPFPFGTVAGFRSWQDIGTTYMASSDNFYVGLRQKAVIDPTGRTSAALVNPNDAQDAVLSWGDNYSGNGPAPDNNLTFIFHAPLNHPSNKYAGSEYGREVMRMNGDGNVGIGPVFADIYQPTSTLHQHQLDAESSWMQITNQYMNTAAATQTGPTAINATNGFRFGILGNNQKIKNGNAYVYNQEERHLIFSTNHTTPTDAQFTNERMRITSISAPTNLTNGGNAAFGVWNPGALTNQDVTRVAISHNPATPVTRPLALLHLGYNTGNTLFPLATPTTDGWRPWMDVGTFASEGTDNAYFGLKKETGFNNDRQDAVISWGDNYSPTNQFGLPTGIDKLRIIFTTPEQGQTAAGPGAMSTADGLEFVRYVPFHNASLGVNDARTGFGDFENLLPVGTINPGNTIEINSIMNGFNAAANTNVTGSYVGSTGASGLRFRDLTSLSIAIPDSIADSLKINRKKVLTVDSLGNVVLINNSGGNSIGNYCSATTTNPLTGDYEIPMNIYNYYFTGQGTGRTNVGVGLPCGTNLGGKVHAYQLANNFFFGSNLGVSVAGRFDNYTSTNAFLGYGVLGNAAGPSSAWNIGVYGTAANAAVSNFAGYFDGDVYTTGGSTSGSGYLVASDKNIKTNINTVTKNLDVISKLRPVSYDFDNSYAPQLKLNNHKNYGFIAQEVESIIPDIVSTTTVIPTFDSLNNVTNPEKVVKALNYDGLIPFAIGGIQELNAKQKEMQASLDKAGLSDAQVKTNVSSFNALAKIKTLNPVQYNFTNANVPQLTFKSNLDYGFVAQQLETVYPELVDTLRIDATYDSLGVVVNPSQVLKTVNYKAMAGLLVRSIQEQQLTIDSLRNAHSKQDSINNAVQQQLANLAALIDGCCHASSRTSNNLTPATNNSLDVELSDKDAIVLNQNVPNPFAEQTTITYNVPASVGKAQLIFFNTNGQVIQTVDIKTRGKGKVNVFASDLSSGLYNYSLVADGKVIDSKKMVRE